MPAWWQTLLVVVAAWFVVGMLADLFAGIRTPIPGRERAAWVAAVTIWGATATYWCGLVLWLWLNVGMWVGLASLVLPFVALWLYWLSGQDAHA